MRGLASHHCGAPDVFPRYGSIVPRRALIDYCRACLAHDIVLGIRASRTADGADNRPLLDQGNAASRCYDPIERQQIVEVHKLDTVLEYFRWPSEGRGGSRLVFRNLN